MDFSDNVQGEISIKAKDPKEVILDPDASAYDPSTWNEVITTTWMSLDEIEEKYGEAKRKQVEDHVSRKEYFTDDSVSFQSRPGTFG